MSENNVTTGSKNASLLSLLLGQSSRATSRPLSTSQRLHSLLNKLPDASTTPTKQGGGDEEEEMEVETKAKMNSSNSKKITEGKNGFVLVGSRESGKTSLLFEYSVGKAAAEPNGRAIFVSASKEKLHEKPPLPMATVGSTDISNVQVKERDPEVLKRVCVKYVKDQKELVQFLANIHNADLPIVSIAVDDLDQICMRTARNEADSLPSYSPSEEKAMQVSSQAHAMALLRNACNALSHKFSNVVEPCVSITALRSADQVASRSWLWFATLVSSTPDAASSLKNTAFHLRVTPLDMDSQHNSSCSTSFSILSNLNNTCLCTYAR